MTDTKMPTDDVCTIRDELREFARTAIADEGTSQDSGAGLGQADFYLTVNEDEYVVRVSKVSR